MFEYVLPIAVFLLIGALAGVILTLASKVLAVKTDDRVEKVLSHLPGINCGACGFSGCEGYAAAIIINGAAPTLCKPGGSKTALSIGDELGIEVKATEKEVAFVHCTGTCDMTGDRYIYNGIESCVASERFYNGKNDCRYGCTGLGDCVSVCENGAISIKNGVAYIDASLCSACGLCIKACPGKLIGFRKISSTVQVACSSHDTPKSTKTACKAGCVACKLCEKKCPNDAIHISDNCSVIDYVKCTSCGICASVCPTKCIKILPECKNV